MLHLALLEHWYIENRAISNGKTSLPRFLITFYQLRAIPLSVTKNVLREEEEDAGC